MSAPQSVALDSVSPPSRSRPVAAMGWMLLACVLFAVMNVVAKSAMRALPWHEVAAGRAVFGALTIFLFARARSIPIVVHDKRTQWKRTTMGVGALLCGFYALSRLPLGDSVTIGNLTPVFIALASRRALGERSSAGLGLAVLLGFAGVALIAGAQLDGGSLANVHAVMIGVAGAAFSCAAMLFLRRLGTHESAEGVSLHFVGWSAVVCIAVGIGRSVVPSPMAALSLVVAGLTGGLAQVAMTKAYGLDRAARVGALAYSGVVFAQILGVVFLAEIPTSRQLFGAALVLLSGALLAGGVFVSGEGRISRGWKSARVVLTKAARFGRSVDEDRRAA